MHLPIDERKDSLSISAMKTKEIKRTSGLSEKIRSTQEIADRLGTSRRAVQIWAASGTLPKNPIIRAAYIKLTVKPKRKQVAK